MSSLTTALLPEPNAGEAAGWFRERDLKKLAVPGSRDGSHVDRAVQASKREKKDKQEKDGSP